MNFRHFVATTALGVVAFGACNVYDSALLTGGSDAGPGIGGSVGGGGTPGDAGSGSSGSSGTATSGGTTGTGGSASPEGGGAGDDTPSGGTDTGGGAGAGSGGTSGAGGNGGAAGTTSGGTAGATGAGAGGTAGAAAGAAGNGGAGGAMAGTGGAAGGPGGAGAGGGGPIVQLTGTATADSEEATPTPHPATHGNDGLTTTRWCAANNGAGHFWTLDLGAVHTLARFEVIWEYPTRAAGLPYGYIVSVSNDGTTFTTVIDRTTTTDTMQIQSSDFPPATSGRHVRITAVTLPNGAWASFFEARVFGQ